MSKFFPRARLMGSTPPFDVFSQPYIRSQKRADPSNNEFADLTPILPTTLNLRFGPSNTPYAVNLLATDTTLDLIADRINATVLAIHGEAYHQDGFLYIKTTPIGQGAYVAVVGGPAAAAMGFPFLPDPYARINSGDIPFSPPGSYEGDHDAGPAFIQRKEEVTAQAVNRGFYQLASNDDVQDHYLRRLMALPEIVEVDVSDPLWAARLVNDGTNYVQLDLTDIQNDFPELSDRIYMAPDLTNQATLRQLSRYYSVQSLTDVEMIVDSKTVRVGAVTHGQRAVPITFPTLPSGAYNEDAVPSASVPDTANWQAGGGLGDGGNILGGGWSKSGPTAINDILYRSGVDVTGALYETENVREGDWAVVAGAAVNVPFNHDGTYLVDELISEERFLLRAQDPLRAELNSDDSGVYGTMEVLAGEFAEGVWLSFVPGIPIGTDFKLVYGVQSSLAEMDFDYLLRLLVRTSEDVDDLVQQVIRIMKGPLVYDTDDFTKYPFANGAYDGAFGVTMESLWTKSTLGGAYQGIGWSEGSGHRAEITHRPAKWINETSRVPVAGVLLFPFVGEVLPGNVLIAPAGGFEVAHVGNTVRFTSPPLDIDSSFQVVEYIDEFNVRLEPGQWEGSSVGPDIPPTLGPINCELYNNVKEVFPFANEVLALPLSQGQGRGGYAYIAESDETPADTDFMTESFLALRQAGVEAETLTFLRDVPVTIVAGEILFPFDPSLSWNIRAQDRDQFGGVIHITNSPDNDGYYRIRAMNAPTGLYVAEMDGGSAALTNDVTGNAKATIYYSTMAAGGSEGVGKYPTGTTFYEDFLETNLAGMGWGALGIGWRGLAVGGIYGIINEDTFTAINPATAEVGATGPAIHFETFYPAYGMDLYHEGAGVGLGIPAQRGGFGARLRGRTFSMDRAAVSSGMYGAAGFFSQQGNDPVLMIGSKLSTGLTRDWADFSDLRSMSAIVGASEFANAMLQGGFMEFYGALYQVDENANFPGSDVNQGGLYSEMSGAFRNALYPMARSSEVYFSDKLRARLGHPGQVLPLSTGATLTVTDIESPALATDTSRSVRTSGWIEWDGTAVDDRLAAPLDRYIGCQVLVTNAGANNGIYTIINCLRSETYPGYCTKVEVVHDAGNLTDIGGTPSGETIQIMGARWHYGYVDLAQFMMIGTESDIAAGGLRDVYKMPLLGAWGTDLAVLMDERILDDLPEPLVDPTNWIWWGRPKAMKSFPAMMDLPYGEGLGDLRSLVSSTGWIGEGVFLNNEWNSFYDKQVAFGGGAFEAVSLSGVQSRTNFGNSEWGWFSSAAHGASGPFVETDLSVDPPTMALTMQLAISNPIAAGVIQMRSKTYGPINLAHYDLTVGVEMELIGNGGMVGDIDVEVEAFTEGGVSLGSDLNTITIGSPVAMHEFVIHQSMVRNGARDAIENIGHWYFVLTFGDMTVGPASNLTVKFSKIVPFSDLKTSFLDGNLLASGGVVSPSFRTPVPVKDFHTVAPAEADLYIPAGYAGETPIIYDGDYTAGLDYPADPPGQAIIRHAYNDGALQEYFAAIEARDLIDFKKGIDYAALRFLSPLMDPILYSSGGPGAPVAGRTDPWSPPGRVGFIMPIRPPHGSILTDMSLAMSFKPSYGINTFDPLNQSVGWQIYYDRNPFRDTVDRNGVRVRLIRQHVFEDIYEAKRRVDSEFTSEGSHFKNGSSADVYAKAVDSWQPVGNQKLGFYEVLYRSYVHLDSSPDQLDPTSGSENTQGVDNLTSGMAAKTQSFRAMGEEYFTNRKYFMLTEAGGGDPSSAVPSPGLPGGSGSLLPDKFVVDRRQYNYYVIIDAWGGPLTGHDASYYQIEPPENDHLELDPDKKPWLLSGHCQPGLAGNSRPQYLPPWARMYLVEPYSGAPADHFTQPWDYYVQMSTPMMKFRGLRYGFEWSRIAPG